MPFVALQVATTNRAPARIYPVATTAVFFQYTLSLCKLLRRGSAIPLGNLRRFSPEPNIKFL